MDRSWYDDAKFGIFIHWGLYTLAGWAETIPTFDPRHSNYVEWYLNTILIENSPAQVRHRHLYGPDWSYEDFKAPFEAGLPSWDPSAWATLFAEAGARYVIPVTRHHDGYSLWPTTTVNPRRAYWYSPRDVVHDLRGEVLERGMRFGLYYSGGFDWTFPIDPPLPITNVAEVLVPMQQSQDYADYVRAQYVELIDRYAPSVLWNDVGCPSTDVADAVVKYFRAAVPDGVVNDRFEMLNSGFDHDFVTRERSDSDTPDEKWELCRGIGMSFGYNQVEADGFDYPTVEELLHELIDVVSRGGNYLLNVAPDPTGVISPQQADRLTGMGAWLRANGEAIFGTRRWAVEIDGAAVHESATSDGDRVAFTRTAESLYAIVLGTPVGPDVWIGGLPISPESAVEVLGVPGCEARIDGSDLRITVGALAQQPAYVVKISPCPPWRT